MAENDQPVFTWDDLQKAYAAVAAQGGLADEEVDQPSMGWPEWPDPEMPAPVFETGTPDPELLMRIAHEVAADAARLRSIAINEFKE